MFIVDLPLRFIFALIAFTFRGWIGWSGILLVLLKVIGVIHWQWWVAALPLEYGVIYCLYMTIDGALYRAGVKNVGGYARVTQGEQEYAKLVAQQAQGSVKEKQETQGSSSQASDESKIREEKLRTLLILNNRWPRSVIDYKVVGDRVEVIDPQRKVLTVLSTAELERMKLEYQRGLDRMRKASLTLQSSIYWSIILIKFVLPAAIILLGIYFAIRFFQ